MIQLSYFILFISCIYIFLPLAILLNTALSQFNLYSLQQDFLSTVQNSLILALSSTACSFFIAFLCIRCGKRVLQIAQLCSFLLVLCPPFLLALLLSFTWINLGIGDSFCSLLIAHSITQFPYVLFFLLLGTSYIPKVIFMYAQLHTKNAYKRFTYFYFLYMKNAIYMGIFISISISLSHYALTIMLSTTATLMTRMIPLLLSGELYAASLYGVFFLLQLPFTAIFAHRLLRRQ